MYLAALIAVNAFWLSLVFAFVPLMCMRALAKAQQDCLQTEGWNFIKMLERWHSGYTAPLELNWVPKSEKGLKSALIVSTVWSLVLIGWSSYEIHLSTVNKTWPTVEGRVVNVEKLPSISTKGLALIDLVSYQSAVIGMNSTIVDENITKFPHAIGDSVRIAYDPRHPASSTLTPGSKASVVEAAGLALLMPIITLLCVVYTAVNLKTLMRLRGSWGEDAPRRLD